jgi:hypothetical protein
MRKFLRDNLTDYDGKTYDTGRSLAWFCVLSLTLLQGWAAYETGAFDPMGYAGGCAAIVACLGVATYGDNAKRP